MKRLSIIILSIVQNISIHAQDAAHWLCLRPSLLDHPSELGGSRSSVPWGEWQSWGEQTDGTYRNPVIPADYSDLDCIRVGNDYYAISSTMQFSPGMTILHSRDLVNWEIAGNAVGDLTQISPALGWQQMDRYGRGIWAGTLRHHKGRFYLFFGTPDEGFFMTTAKRANGPWEPLTPLLQEPGWDDCSAIWDQEGQAWFVGTCFRDGYKTYLFRMAKDGRSIDRSSARLINEGNGREASKLIWHDGLHAGLCHFAEHSASLGIVNKGGTNYLEWTDNDQRTRHQAISSTILYLRSTWDLDGKSQFSYSLDGNHYTPLGQYQLLWGFYRGDRIGIYCFNEKGEQGYVDYFHYDMAQH